MRRNVCTAVVVAELAGDFGLALPLLPAAYLACGVSWPFGRHPPSEVLADYVPLATGYDGGRREGLPPSSFRRIRESVGSGRADDAGHIRAVLPAEKVCGSSGGGRC